MNKLETKQKVVEQVYEKPEFERLVDEYLEADQLYLAVEEQFMSGNLLKEILGPGVSVERAIDEFKTVIEEMKNLLEDRNSKLTLAKNSLRAAVQLSETQYRGPEGKPNTLTYGPFVVSSVTRRGLNAEKLMDSAGRAGCLQELMALSTMDKSGNAMKLIEQRYAVDYTGVVGWLKQRKLDSVVADAYEEKDGTPMVKGPKKLAFLGEKKEDGKDAPP
jgi:hypothetical protein